MTLFLGHLIEFVLYWKKGRVVCRVPTRSNLVSSLSREKVYQRFLGHKLYTEDSSKTSNSTCKVCQYSSSSLPKTLSQWSVEIFTMYPVKTSVRQISWIGVLIWTPFLSSPRVWNHFSTNKYRFWFIKQGEKERSILYFPFSLCRSLVRHDFDRFPLLQTDAYPLPREVPLVVAKRWKRPKDEKLWFIYILILSRWNPFWTSTRLNNARLLVISTPKM